jgi:hypothetical protein
LRVTSGRSSTVDSAVTARRKPAGKPAGADNCTVTG